MIRDLSGANFKYDSVLMVETLFDSDFNCRGEFTYESVAELAETIETVGGLLYPVIVWPRPGLPPGKKNMLVAGHRRFRAYELLKQTHIPAIIRADLDLRTAEIINLTENLARKDLNIMQEALAIKKRYPEGGPLRAIAKELGKSATWVEDRLQVAKMPVEVQLLLAAGRVAGHYIQKIHAVFLSHGPEAAIEAANTIARAKQASNGELDNKLPDHLRKRPFKKPKQADVLKMMATLLDQSIVGLLPKYAAWREGWIDTEVFLKDVKKRIPKWSRRIIEETEFPDTP